MSALTKLTDEQYARLQAAVNSGELAPLVTELGNQLVADGQQRPLDFLHFTCGLNYEDILVWLADPSHRPEVGR